MSALSRHNVSVSGRPDGQPIVFAHGFGCDQHMWRLITPAFEDDYRVVVFDLAGSGGSAPEAYDESRHASLQGYADDIVEICRELEITDGIFVGHSVSSMIGALADAAAPELFEKLVMIGPSPRYIDDDEYVGGFSEADVRELLESLESNYLGWSSAMAPAIMGNPDRPALGDELTESFCRTDPDRARRFAEVTFLSDNRADLPSVQKPTLVLQCTQDAIAPVAVGRYVAETMPNATMVLLDATGHCPHLSAPDQTIAAMTPFVRGDAVVGA
jgi:sigma-B regulation protein RsbQ